MALTGGGSRRRKRHKKLPGSPLAVARSRQAFEKKAFPGLKAKWSGASLRSKWLSHNGREHEYKVTIMRPVFKGKRCVYFVARSSGQDAPYDAKEKPYEVTKLCNGGRSWTGLSSRKTLSDAKASAKRLAKFEREGK